MEEFNEIMFDAAGEFGIPQTLIAGIIQVESGGDPWGFRYEPAFLQRYVEEKPRRFGAISTESERIARATSWGLMQVMGQVARERGFNGAFLSELCDPTTGIYYGCKHFAHLRDRFVGKHGMNGVIAAYNAGSPRYVNGVLVNQGYVEKVLSASRS